MAYATFALAAAEVVTYVYSSPQGTVLAETDESGNVTAQFEYRAYGASALGGSPNGPGYTGHVSDADTGLVYMQARYYDPIAGRFLSMDPVGSQPGNLFDFNRFAYANDNPIANIDPDGRTCKKVGKAYSCQIDRVVTHVDGKTETHKATAEDHKTYAAVEATLTQAVNAAASSGKSADISFESGGTTYSFSVSGGSIAKSLAERKMNIDGGQDGAMTTDGNTTTIQKSGLTPGTTVIGSPEKTQEMYFLHEGIHRTSEERKALGWSGLRQMDQDQDAHQSTYNAAAISFMGDGQ
nr:RHS repeat-associated core domain-containing protein [Dyella kyungheensis]